MVVRDGMPAGMGAANALCNLSTNEAWKASIAAAQAGGIEALVALVIDGSPEAQAAAAKALCHVSLSDDNRKASIASAGGINALVALVRNGMPAGKAAAANALGHMSLNDDNLKASIASAGGINALVALVATACRPARRRQRTRCATWPTRTPGGARQSRWRAASRRWWRW